jgi:hypothetical protein
MTKEELVTKEELDKYRAFVKDLSDNECDKVFLNSSPEHAVIVVAQIFRQSKDTVRIFAHNLIRTIGEKYDYILALSEFIERGGAVRILLNGFDADLARNSSLYRRFNYFATCKKDIQIKTTNVHPYLAEDKDQKEIHFTIGDRKAFRIETNTKEVLAECNMNGTKVATQFADFFDDLFNDEEKTANVNLLTFLDHAE